MLQLFRRNMALYSLILLPYVLIVHGGRFVIHYGQEKVQHCWVFDRIDKFLGLSEQSSFYIASFIVFLEALLINRLVNHHKLIPEGQLFAGLVFIVVTGFHPLFYSLTPVLVGNLFFILALQSMTSTYLMKSASISIFNFGFYIAIASLLYLPFFYMLFLGIFGLMVFRGFSVREFSQMISGTISVFVLFWLYLYWTKESENFWNDQVHGYFSSYIFSIKIHGKGIVATILIFLLLIMVIIRYKIFHIRTGIGIQKIYDFLFWTMAISLIGLTFMKINSVSHWIIFITYLSVFLATMLSKIKNELVAETIHLFFALFALFLQLQNW